METGDTGGSSAALHGDVQAVIPKLLASPAEPQGLGVSQAMRPAQPQVAVDAADHLGAERHHAPLATHATPHHGQAALHIDVLDDQAEHLARSHPGLDEQTGNGLVAPVDELLALARLDQRRALVVAQALDDLGVELGRLQTADEVNVDLVLVQQPGAVPLERVVIRICMTRCSTLTVLTAISPINRW